MAASGVCISVNGGLNTAVYIKLIYHTLEKDVKMAGTLCSNKMGHPATQLEAQ